jgi:hypothetical protein
VTVTPCWLADPAREALIGLRVTVSPTGGAWLGIQPDRSEPTKNSLPTGCGSTDLSTPLPWRPGRTSQTGGGWLVVKAQPLDRLDIVFVECPDRP